MAEQMARGLHNTQPLLSLKSFKHGSNSPSPTPVSSLSYLKPVNHRQLFPAANRPQPCSSSAGDLKISSCSFKNTVGLGSVVGGTTISVCNTSVGTEFQSQSQLDSSIHYMFLLGPQYGSHTAGAPGSSREPDQCWLLGCSSPV